MEEITRFIKNNENVHVPIKEEHKKILKCLYELRRNVNEEEKIIRIHEQDRTGKFSR